MIRLLLVVIGLLLAGVALLSVGIWLKKDGKFPNIHIGHNPEMRKRGIGCVEEQDARARMENPFTVSEKRDK